MENIVYLDDYINLYNKKNNKIIKIKPYKDTLKYGKIINRKKFIKIFNKIKEEYKLNHHIFSERIHIIINSTYNVEDKKLLYDIFEELNYKDIKYINELDIIKINKKSLLINYNDTFFNIYYINELGNIKIKIYENDYINKKLFVNILKIINKDTVIIIGKNIFEGIKVLDKMNFNYFYYEDYENLYLKLLTQVY